MFNYDQYQPDSFSPNTPHGQHVQHGSVISPVTPKVEQVVINFDEGKYSVQVLILMWVNQWIHSDEPISDKPTF